MSNKQKVTMAVEVIVDDSGSMNSISGRVVRGINTFIKQLATAVTPVSVSVTRFNTRLRSTLIDYVPVCDLPQLKQDDYHPTAPDENIAFSIIQALEERLAKVDAYQKVLVVVTDGLNRSSSMDKANALIRKRMKEGWLILWLGTCYDGGGEHYKQLMRQYAKLLGIPDGLTFAFDNSNFDKVMPLAAQAALRFSGLGDAKAAEFTKAERKIA